jgi:hypothetical protein
MKLGVQYELVSRVDADFSRPIEVGREEQVLISNAEIQAYSQEERRNKSSVSGATLNFVNSIVGAGHLLLFNQS